MKKEYEYIITESQLIELINSSNGIKKAQDELESVCNSQSTGLSQGFALGQLNYEFKKLSKQTESIMDKIYYQNPERVMMINLKDLKQNPEFHYLKYFDENGNGNILKMVEKEDYGIWTWFFKNSNNFDWFQPDKFDWYSASDLVVKHCPQHFDAEKFNWDQYGNIVPEYYPQFFDEEKFNWRKDSWLVARYAPKFFNKDKFVWDEQSEKAVREYHPELLKFKPK